MVDTICYVAALLGAAVTFLFILAPFMPDWMKM